MYDAAVRVVWVFVLALVVPLSAGAQNTSPEWLPVEREADPSDPGFARLANPAFPSPETRAVPIDRGFGKEGLQTVLGLLGQGRAIVVFPEGERTHDGTLQPLKPGISLLVKRANCQIVPVGISGCYDMWSRHAKRPEPETLFEETGGRSIGLHYGEPVHSSVYRTMDRDAMLADLQARIAVSVTKAEKLRRRP